MAGVGSSELRETGGYQPPTIRSLGLVEELTAGADNRESITKTQTAP